MLWFSDKYYSQFFIVLRIAVVGKALADKATEKEKWYGTDYRMDDISKEQLDLWDSAGLNDLLHLPDKNEFVPSSFDLLKEENVSALYLKILCLDTSCI